MGEEGRKVSFGFSKLKKTNLVKPVIIPKEEVDYVDSFDGRKGKFSYKGNIRSDEIVKKPLVIPLVGTKTAYEVIKSRLESINDEDVSNHIKKELVEVPEVPQNGKSEHLETESSAVPQSIEALAARELLKDIHQNQSLTQTSSSMVIAQSSVKPNLQGEQESSLEDYQNVPINDFGLAMLRGMGWKPETGIGKEQKVVPAVMPKLRPKGLGLGADKVLARPPESEDLTIALKSYVKFRSGQRNGAYGQVEAVDADCGRVVVKLALGGNVSVSELLLIPVTRKDYEKNSKVLNAVKYEEYLVQKKESRQEPESKSSQRQKRDRPDDRSTHRKEKFSRDRSRENYKSSHSEGSKEHKESSRHSSSRKRRETDSSKSSDSEKERKRSKHKKEKSRKSSRDRRHKKKKKKKKKKYSSDSD